jgi:hypothetical protein
MATKPKNEQKSSKKRINLDNLGITNTRQRKFSNHQNTQLQSIQPTPLAKSRDYSLQDHERFRRLKTIPQFDITYQDRQFIKEYISDNNITNTGMCWCFRPYLEKVVERPDSPYIGLKYYGCKYGTRGCKFFRWIEFAKYKVIKTRLENEGVRDVRMERE